MTFTRTASGLSNYNKFFNVDFMVYIEGSQSKKDDSTFDSIFYSSLFELFFPSQHIKLKIVGCKNNVLDYNDKLIKHNVDNSCVIIDRDYDEIFYSRIANDKLIQTHGYSWENDFWSLALCEEVIKYICTDHDIGNQILNDKFKRSIYRLHLINRANVICKYFGNEIFTISKKGGTNGFNYDVKDEFPLSKNERRRLFDKIPENIKEECSREIINRTKLHHRCLIQGHFYEYMWLHILSYASKKSSNSDNKTNDFLIIKNIAFNLFKKETNKFLSQETIEYYKFQFDRVLKITA